MASNPPGQCCIENVRHEGQPNGEHKKVGGVDAYVAQPKGKKSDHAIVIFPDVLGHVHQNVQLVADQFAANGYLTLIPDLFNGDAIPAEAHAAGTVDVQAWLKNHGTDVTDPLAELAIKAARSEFGAKKVGAVGYCFGAKYVTRFMGKIGADQDAVIDVGYVAHPSFVAAEELKAITGPYSIAAAMEDQIFPQEKRKESEDILRELCQKDERVAWQINLFSNVKHGFGNRADLSSPRAKFAKELAFLQAVSWFNHYL